MISGNSGRQKGQHGELSSDLLRGFPSGAFLVGPPHRLLAITLQDSGPHGATTPPGEDVVAGMGLSCRDPGLERGGGRLRTGPLVRSEVGGWR